MNWKLMVVALGAGVLVGCTGGADDGDAAGADEPAQEDVSRDDTAEEQGMQAPYVLGRTMNRIDGTPEDLAAYDGRVVLVVNVASACGLTPQYAGLESLYRERRDDGFVVLGFPANNFGGQEPGTNEEIQAFCTGEYGVSFPMFEKISVAGETRHPLYDELSTVGGEPTWNFTKYLVDRNGHVVERFDPRTAPNDPALTSAIDRLIGEG